MKLRGAVDVVGPGVIPEIARRISDERKWE